jgi:YD repeat-containing protein
MLQQVAPGSGLGSFSPMVGDPINASNGNEMLTETDYQSAGGSLLNFERTYNSGAGFTLGALGAGWSHTYRYRAYFGSDGSTVVLARPDGSSVTFVLTQGAYVGPAAEKGTLQGTFSSGTLTSLKYIRPDGTVEAYTGATGADWGLPSQIFFGQGGVLTFINTTGGLPSKVQDDRGHTLQFTYTAVNNVYQLNKVTMPDATSVTYGYDTYGRLVSATYSNQTTRTYSYLPATNANGTLSVLANELTGVIAENGNPVVNVTYDSSGRATSSWRGSVGAELTQVSYGSSSATVTDAMGAVSQMAFTNVNGPTRSLASLVTKSCMNGCVDGQSSEGFAFDYNGNVSLVTTKQGFQTCLSYTTPRNLPVLVVEGLPSGTSCSDALASPPAGALVRTYQWHASYAVPMVVTGPQKKVLFNYDTAGRMLTRAEVETTDTTGAAGTNAQQTGTARTSSWTYNSKGSVLSAKAPRTDVNATTTFGYDGAENLVSMVSPTGLTTTFGSYDANGRPGLVTYPNGLQSTLSYDARGRLSQVVTGGVATTYGYDAAGLLVSVSLPSGVSLSMGYDDANRLSWTQDSLGNRVDLVLDAAGNVVQQTVKGNGGAIALSSQAAFDQLSRMPGVNYLELPASTILSGASGC